ncbi:MAG TPA: sulfatase-like hydrolase/transferase [Polyangiaceae bacterium]|nr:sulfatase-like hydrolase/transferase [Polyangiaceae bacterium]
MIGGSGLPRVKHWLLAGWLTSITVSLSEAICTAVLSPLARGSLGALTAALVASTGVLLVWSLPLALLCALLSSRFERMTSWMNVDARVIVASAKVAFIVALSGHLLYLQVDPTRYEFLSPVRLLATFGLCLIALCAGVLFPLLLARVRMGLLDAPEAGQWWLAALCATIALSTLAVLHFGPSTVYTRSLNSGATLLTLILLIFAHRAWTVRSPDLRGRTVSALLGGTLVLSGIASQSPSARLLVVTREPMAGSAVSWLQRLFDFDHDGSAPKFFWGDDCAAFDAAVGPGIRKNLPTDQDCHPSAIVAAAAPPTGGPWQQCVQALQDNPPPLNVVVLTIDALRADTFEAQVPPGMKQFLARSAVFTKAYAPSPTTYTSFPALYSGRTVSDLVQANALLGATLTSQNDVVRRFRDRGYRTVGVTLLKRDELGDGFKEFGGFSVDPPAPGGGKADFYSGALSAQALSHFNPTVSSPVFLWLHQTDVHAPYKSIERSVFPKPEGSDYERAAAYSLLRSSEFLERVLRQHGNDTVIVLSADHGEELGKNGRHGHGPELTEDVLRVPLVLYVPGCPGITVSHPVSALELGPALLKLTRLGASSNWSLLDSVNDARTEPIVAESFGGGRVERALIDGTYKLRVDVGSGGKVAFDLQRDPEELHNVYGGDSAISERLDADYDRWLSRHLR